MVWIVPTAAEAEHHAATSIWIIHATYRPTKPCPTGVRQQKTVWNRGRKCFFREKMIENGVGVECWPDYSPKSWAMLPLVPWEQSSAVRQSMLANKTVKYKCKPNLVFLFLTPLPPAQQYNSAWTCIKTLYILRWSQSYYSFLLQKPIYVRGEKTSFHTSVVGIIKGRVAWDGFLTNQTLKGKKLVKSSFDIGQFHPFLIVLSSHDARMIFNCKVNQKFKFGIRFVRVIVPFKPTGTAESLDLFLPSSKEVAPIKIIKYTYYILYTYSQTELEMRIPQFHALWLAAWINYLDRCLRK